MNRRHFIHSSSILAAAMTMPLYDDKAGKFNRQEADKYLKPAYRSPWKFPQI